MFRSFGLRSGRYRVLFVGAATLLSVTVGALPRGPTSIDIPIPITDPADPFLMLLQTGPTEVPLPTAGSVAQADTGGGDGPWPNTPFIG